MIPFNVANKITTACLKKDQNVIISIEDEYHEIAIMTAKRVSAKNCPILVNMHDWAIDRPLLTAKCSISFAIRLGSIFALAQLFTWHRASSKRREISLVAAQWA